MLRQVAGGTVAALCLVLVSVGPASAGGDIDFDPNQNDIELGPSDPGDPDTWNSGYDGYEETPDTGTSDTSDTNVEDDDPCLGDAELINPGTCGWFSGPTPEGEEGPGPVWVDPGELAQSVLDELPLPAPEVRMAPAGTGGAPSLVNLPTWLWVDGGWESLSKSATAGQTTVAVTVEPVRVDWGMGEGSVSCSGPGTPWTGGNEEHSPSGCDYTYVATGDYDTSATIQFQADWTCTGFCLADSGTLGVVAGPSTSTPVEVSERQSVVIE